MKLQWEKNQYTKRVGGWPFWTHSQKSKNLNQDSDDKEQKTKNTPKVSLKYPKSNLKTQNTHKLPQKYP